ncbi:MAG TPA: carbohydrate ABC transporter permease [Bacilli bacterium]
MRTALKYAAAVAISLLSLIPFYVLLFLSLNAPSFNFFEESLFMPDFYFHNYAEAWVSSHIGRAIGNSLIITVGSVALNVLLASSAGYAIARFRNRLHRAIFTVFLLSMMIPAIIITVPLYTLMRSIGGINTLWAMILLMASTVMPFSVFLYTSFIRAIPKEIEESAIIDGCTHFTAFFRVTFFFLAPVTSAVVILTGLQIWNNYGQAIFFLQSQSVQTIPLAISMFFQQYGAKWNLMGAAAVIGVLPPIVAFLAFQRYFIKGIMAGALKG